jgi:hypothetical protein
MRFTSDYERENPVTKNEGFLKMLDRKITLEDSNEKKANLTK